MSSFRLFLLVLVALCASCGSARAERSAPGYAPPPVQTVHQSGVESAQIQVSDDAVTTESAGLFSKRARAEKSTGASPAPQPERQAIDKKLIKNGWLTVEVRDEDDIEPAVEKVEHIARQLEGYISHQTTSSATVRIPTGRLDEAVAAISALGKVTRREITVSDVTANYVDLAIRIDNLRRVRKRLQELVEQGQNVQEILEVEKELTRVTTQLESLEGQMRVLETQIAYATLHVNFDERVMPGPIGWVFYGTYHAIKWLFVWD